MVQDFLHQQNDGTAEETRLLLMRKMLRMVYCAPKKYASGRSDSQGVCNSWTQKPGPGLGVHSMRRLPRGSEYPIIRYLGFRVIIVKAQVLGIIRYLDPKREACL